MHHHHRNPDPPTGPAAKAGPATSPPAALTGEDLARLADAGAQDASLGIWSWPGYVNRALNDARQHGAPAPDPETLAAGYIHTAGELARLAAWAEIHTSR